MAIDIKYDGKIIASPLGGQTATLANTGQVMKTDLVVGAVTPCSIIQGNAKTPVPKGKIATLRCAGKRMGSNVVLAADGLPIPTLALSGGVYGDKLDGAIYGDILTITDESGAAEEFEIYVDGELIHVHQNPTSGLAYTLSAGKDFYTCSGIGVAEDDHIIVAKEFEGLPVTGVGMRAFGGNETIVSSTIPEGIETIGLYAFSGCVNLLGVHIADTVKTIGANAFSLCSKLMRVTVPKRVTRINQGTFEGCTNLTKVTFEGTITEIGRTAFQECTSLTNITIPNSVTSIGEKAFYKCTGLKNITIPDGVTTIETHTFEMSGLTSIVIPVSVTSIKQFALSSGKLTDVYYKGTQEQWAAISKHYESGLDNATVHYNYYEGDV